MRNRILTVVAIACLVTLAGCSGTGPAADSATVTPTDAESAATATATEAAATESTATDGTPAPSATATAAASPTATATASATSEPWTHPEIPNKPMEDKTDAEPQDRISSVEIVDTVASENGSGYSNFDLEVHANTSMPRVDPASHGTVEGEPYFLVYANEQLLERSAYVVQDENGTFDITMRPGGLDRLDAGEVDLTVELVDRDSEYDDVYGVWNGTVRYRP